MACYDLESQSVKPLPDSVQAVDDSVESSDASESDSSNISNVDMQPSVDSINLRSVPDSAVAALKKDKDFAYANDNAYLAKEPENNDKGFWDYFWQIISSKGATVFIYILIVAVLVFAFYKIVVDNKLYLFYSKPKKLNALVNNEVDISKEDIDDNINKAMLAKDYRLGIRYMHIKALRLLDEKGLIHFSAEATNHEYLLKLSATKFGKDFQYLTNAYEYAWYGGFGLTDEKGEMIRQNFNKFYSTIQN